MDSVWVLTSTDMDSSEILCIWDGKHDFEEIRTHIHKTFSKLDESLWQHEKDDLRYIMFKYNLYEINRLKVVSITNG